MPEAISFQTAATILLQGLTTQYLATDRDKTLKGETVLIHASAGGIEQFLTQISMLLFATLIGLTTSASKAKIALKNGADNVFLYSEDRKDQILSFSANAVDVLYDSVGNKLSNSFEVTKDCEQVVIFGMAGGEPDFINPRMLTDPSKTLTGGDLWSYLISKEERIKRANQLFDWINNDKITIATPTVFKLSEGEKAHNYLEIRKSTAKVILIP